MDEQLLEKIQRALPPYLSAETKKELLAQLLRYPDNKNYYGTIPGETEPLQGDGWRGFIVVNFHDAQRDAVLGLVVSNSCDIAAENEPDPDQCLLFAPMLDLDRYAALLQEAGKTPQQIGDLLADIRKQEIHRLFYLPPMPGMLGESIVRLDDVHAQPLSSIKPENIQRVFSLNQYGWYVLLIKLSIHFTRMAEHVEREFPEPPHAAAPRNYPGVPEV